MNLILSVNALFLFLYCSSCCHQPYSLGTASTNTVHWSLFLHRYILKHTWGSCTQHTFHVNGIPALFKVGCYSYKPSQIHQKWFQIYETLGLHGNGHQGYELLACDTLLFGRQKELLPSSGQKTLNMETASSSKTSIPIHQTIRHHIPDITIPIYTTRRTTCVHVIKYPEILRY